MKTQTSRLLAAMVMGFSILSFGSINLWAEDKAKPNASADIGVFSQYIWRGFELSYDSIVIQPSLTVGY